MTTIEGTVRIPPYRFDEPLEDVAIARDYFVLHDNY